MIAHAPTFHKFNSPVFPNHHNIIGCKMNLYQNSIPSSYNLSKSKSSSSFSAPFIINQTLFNNAYYPPSCSSPQTMMICKNKWPIIQKKSTKANASRSSKEKPKSKQIDKSNQRKKFTPEEDEKLKSLVDKMGCKKWDSIAKEMPGRTGRQCRDRYKNYLIPGFFNGQWSKEEDDLLRRKYYEYGSQWSKITQFFTQRSANALKNRWNYFVSRHLDVAPCENIHTIYTNIDLNANMNVNYNVNQENHDDEQDSQDDISYENIIDFAPSINPFIDIQLEDIENANQNEDLNFKDDSFDYQFILRP